jgi:hypothetical protein
MGKEQVLSISGGLLVFTNVDFYTAVRLDTGLILHIETTTYFYKPYTKPPKLNLHVTRILYS